MVVIEIICKFAALKYDILDYGYFKNNKGEARCSWYITS